MTKRVLYVSTSIFKTESPDLNRSLSIPTCLRWLQQNSEPSILGKNEKGHGMTFSNFVSELYLHHLGLTTYESLCLKAPVGKIVKNV